MTSPGDPERRKGTALRLRAFFSRQDINKGPRVRGFKGSRVGSLFLVFHLNPRTLESLNPIDVVELLSILNHKCYIIKIMIKTASQYHSHTSYKRGRMGGHYLDWQNQPDVFKKYQGITPIPLPDETPSLIKDLWSVLKETDIDPACRKMDINHLSLILRLTCTLTARARHGAEDFFYRSAASAGALYPTEIYVATRGVKGLDDGLYHFAIRGHALSPVRDHDISVHISSLVIPSAEKLPVITFFFTAIFFRSSWKYRDRAYRYHLLDTGHVIENLVLSLKAIKAPFSLSYDFDDTGINRLLGVDDSKEVCLAVARIPGLDNVHDLHIKDVQPLPDNILQASKVSMKETDYPAIQEIHRAGYTSETKFDLAPDIPETPALIAESWQNLADVPLNADYVQYPECLFKRRSGRNFVNQAIGKNSLLSLLDSLCLDNKIMLQDTIGHQLLTVGFQAGNIESLNPGLYVLDTVKKRFGMISAGNLMADMARACLEQEWLRNAGVHFLFISDLNLIDRTCGPRGYRYAMMTAGRMGQRIYLATTSVNLGCCGIGAFYDDEGAGLIGLDQDSRLLYLVAVGMKRGN
jgi:SagB-type dehydrogenase family enzyme